MEARGAVQGERWARNARLLGLGLLGAALAGACGPPAASGTVNAWVYALGNTPRTYELRRAEIDDLESLQELRGRSIDVRGGATASLSEGELDIGVPFILDYALQDDGTVVPGDADSLYALSVYHHLRWAIRAFEAHGLVLPRRVDVLYFPYVTAPWIGDGRILLADNAAFYGAGILVSPSFALGDRPLLLNQGVVAHELGHLVVQQQVFGPALAQWQHSVGETCRSRHFQSIHEGVADLFGFALTGDPDFGTATLPDPAAFPERDVSVPWTYAQANLDQLGVAGAGGTCSVDADTSPLSPSFDPHFHGSFLARAIYELWPKEPDGTLGAAERARLVDVLLRSLARLRPDDDPGFTLAALPDALVAELPPSERPAACAVLARRLAPLASHLTACGTP